MQEASNLQYHYISWSYFTETGNSIAYGGWSFAFSKTATEGFTAQISCCMATKQPHIFACKKQFLLQHQQ